MDTKEKLETGIEETDKVGRDLLQPGDVIATGFDDCIIGVATVILKGKMFRRVVYDATAMVSKLAEEEFNNTPWPAESALEYLEFNTFNAYVGDKTPIYVWSTDMIEADLLTKSETDPKVIVRKKGDILELE